MTAPRKKLLVLLLVVGLLFAVTMFLGIFKGGQPDDIGAVEDSGLGFLGGLTSLFAPPIELAGLNCVNQRVDRQFELSEQNDNCSLDIRRDGDRKYRHAELEVQSSGVTVYVFAKFDSERFKKSERDNSKCFLEDEALATYRLEVVYTPRDDSDTDWECWLKQDKGKPVSVTVMSDGGRLKLTCRGCDADTQPQRVVRMQMK